MERKIDERILKGKNKTGSLINLRQYSSEFIETKSVREDSLKYLNKIYNSFESEFERRSLEVSESLSNEILEEISSYTFSKDFNLTLELYFKKGLIRKYIEILPHFVFDLMSFLVKSKDIRINSFVLPISIYSLISNQNNIDAVFVDDYFLKLGRKRKDKIKFRKNILDLFSTFNFKKVKSIIFPLSTSLSHIENTKIVVESVKEFLLEKNKIGCRIYYSHYKVEDLANLNTPILSYLLVSDFTYYTSFFGRGGPSKDESLSFSFLKNGIFVETTSSVKFIEERILNKAKLYGISEERLRANLLRLKAFEKGVLTKSEFKKLSDFLDGLFKIEEFVLNNKFKETQEELVRLPEFSKIKQKIEKLGK